jgi:hypothetical protein
VITFTSLKQVLDLPHDTYLIRANDHHTIAASETASTVYRITPTPNDATITHAHTLAWDMASHDLNVLRPCTPTPDHRAGHTISASPLAHPLTSIGWPTGGPEGLGAALTRWDDYSRPDLPVLNVAQYAEDRVTTAADSPDPALRHAAERCHDQLVALHDTYPWDQLLADAATVHGDPHLGNLVLHPSSTTPAFIDLDTSKTGPRGYDLAVMNQYVTRYQSTYPADRILAAYRTAGGVITAERLRALTCWKELSSQTYLLTQWHDPDVRAEYEHRARHPHRPWANITRTPMSAPPERPVTLTDR